MRSKSQNSPAVIRQSAQCVAGLKVSNSVLGPEAAIGDPWRTAQFGLNAKAKTGFKTIVVLKFGLHGKMFDG